MIPAQREFPESTVERGEAFGLHCEAGPDGDHGPERALASAVFLASSAARRAASRIAPNCAADGDAVTSVRAAVTPMARHIDCRPVNRLVRTG